MSVLCHDLDVCGDDTGNGGEETSVNNVVRLNVEVEVQGGRRSSSACGCGRDRD